MSLGTVGRPERQKDRHFLPAYKLIGDDLRRKIEQNHWPRGAMLPSRDALAKEYSVAVGTIQRAVNVLVTEGALRADGGRGTFVVGSGEHSGLKTTLAPSRMIASVFQQGAREDSPNERAIGHGLSQTLQEKDPSCHLVMFNTLSGDFDQSIAQERRALDVIKTEGFAALVIWHYGGTETLPQLQSLQAGGVPVVFVDRYPPQITCDFVGIDNRSSARTAVEHLLELGHRRVAFLTYEETSTSVQEREQGYRDALIAAGLAVEPEMIVGIPHTNFKRGIDRATEYFLGMSARPTALFAVHDGVAYALMASAGERGWRVPDDLSIIGFDDSDRYSYRPQVLTTIHQPFETIGRRAAELLLQRLAVPREAREIGQHIYLPTHLVVRSTTRPYGGAVGKV